MTGFGSKRVKHYTSRYWISCYEEGNDDDPISIHRTEIHYQPGQNKEEKMLSYCYDMFRSSQEIWEILVHQGPSDVPDSGDQIVARLSRGYFNGCEELTI